MARIIYFECTKCGKHLSPDEPRTVCPDDGGSLFVRYDLQPYIGKPKQELMKHGTATLWRYAAVLPDAEPVSLGEGYTPLIQSRHNKNLFIKDEGLNPTGSFKARGLAVAITMSKVYGLKKIAIPSAGNAAGALSAYAAAAGIEAHIFMPKDVPKANIVECQQYGAHINLVDGLINDCGKIVTERKEAEGWFDISTMKEPFRVEGKKTMAYELAEQLAWRVPDAILYPTGGGTGLIGMWKAFDEMESLGWIGSERPKMIAVQSATCGPIAKAFQEGKRVSDFWPNAKTIAPGLRVPKPYADYLILDILYKSDGTGVTVTDEELMKAVAEIASTEGVLMCPEGAATFVAYQKLINSKFLKQTDITVLFNTASGLKYLDVISEDQVAGA